MKIVYFFTRDLRIPDNKCLYSACKEATSIIPIFVFTPEQVSKNSYKSNNAIQFMIESLEDLNRELNNKLNLFYGKYDKILEEIIKNENPDKIFMTKDYTPYAVRREESLKKVCEKYDIEASFHEDYCLYPPNKILTLSGNPYQKYTPYYRSALKITPDKTVKVNLPKIKKINSNFSFIEAKKLYVENQDLNRRGGRKNGLKQMENLKNIKDYSDIRNELPHKTTELSAYIKFGNVSIREVYWNVRKLYGVKSEIIAQLIWHDFYYQLGYNFPNIFGHALKPQYDKIKWSKNEKTLTAWKEGKTGYPIVDACMTQLNETGYMHNRGRLIVASFLVKTLLHDWREGEKYFAQKLEDYDPLVNNGNWQWVSSSGADSQPYFRIFNPWLQSKRFDTDGTYIKKYLPVLNDIPPKELHEWDKNYQKYPSLKYPKPIVNYATAKDNVLSSYKKALLN